MKVSVASISYNHEPYIETYIEGIMSQVKDLELAGHSLEVNLVFDCPTDYSIARAMFMLADKALSLCNYRFGNEDASCFRIGQDSVVKVINNVSNMGGPASLTKALSMCTGDVISYLETDDYYKPGKLIKSLNFMLENDLDGVHTDIDCITSSGEYREAAWSKTMWQEQIISLDRLRSHNVVYTCSFLGRAYMISKAPSPAMIATKHKWLGDFSLIAWCVANGYKIGWFPESLSVYRDSIGIGAAKREEMVQLDILTRQWIEMGCPVEGYFEPN